MTRRLVVANALTYDFAPDDEPRLAERDWAIACAQLIDDLTATPLRTAYRVRVVLPGTQTEVAQDGSTVRRSERAIQITHGLDGTFALVARPWLRFFPFGGPASVTTEIEADGFEPGRQTFPVTYDQRTIAAIAPIGSSVITLNSTAGLFTGQTLLLGPSTRPQYPRIRSISGAQVTLSTGVLAVQNSGDPVVPDTFATPPMVRVPMRRRAVSIVGRVVRRNTATGVTNPVSNAAVTVTDFWRTAAAVRSNPSNGAMTDPTPANRQFAVSVSPGVLAERPAGASVGPVVLPTANDDRRLSLASEAADARIEVDRRQNLQPAPAPLPNRLLLVDATDPGASEYHTIATIAPATAGPSEPVSIGLTLSLARSHRAGAVVARLNPGAFGPPGHTLMSAAARGDRCLFLDAAIPLPAPATLRLSGGTAVDEFQTFAPLSVRSDANGYFRLPPIQRMARVAVTVDDGLGHVLPPIEIDPDYGEPEHRIDAAYLV